MIIIIIINVYLNKVANTSKWQSLGDQQINTEEYDYDFRKPSLNTMEHAKTFILSLKSFSFSQTTVVSNN